VKENHNSPGHRFRPEKVSKATIKSCKYHYIGNFEEVIEDCDVYKWNKDCGFNSLLLKDFGGYFEVWEIGKAGYQRLFKGPIKFKRELEFFKTLI